MKKQWKYKAGELVELSAAGKKVRSEIEKWWVCIGMIMSIDAEEKPISEAVSLSNPVVRLQVHNVPDGMAPNERI